MPLTAEEIWRDFETIGVPASGAHKPIKADIRAWGSAIEATAGLAVPGVEQVPLFSNGVGAPPIYRHIVGFDLPNPSGATPGAVFEKVPVTGQVLIGLGSDGKFITGSMQGQNDPQFTGTLFMDGEGFLTALPTGNHTIYGPDGRLAIQLQAGSAFYKSNLHTWTDNSGGDQFATLNNATLSLLPRDLGNLETLSAFSLTQSWNTGAGAGGGLVYGVDWRFLVTSTHPGSRLLRIRAGAAGNNEMFAINSDSGNPVLFLAGGATISKPPGQPLTFYSTAAGTGFVNAAGNKFLAQFSDTGVWSFFGSTSGSHTLAAAAAASGASTFPNTSGELINTGMGAPNVLLGAAVDFNAVGDVALAVKLPTGFTKYRIGGMTFFNTGPGAATLNNTQYGVFTAAAGGGTALAAAAASNITTNAAGATGGYQQVTAAAVVNSGYFDITTTPTIFARVTQAQGAAALGRFTVQINPIS